MIALLIDIGNSRIKWRMADLDGVEADGSFPRWVSTESAIALADVGGIEAALRATADASATPDSVLVANVASEAVGDAIHRAVAAIRPGAPVRHVRAVGAACGLVNAYRDPARLGVDRWLAAIAAHALHPDRSVLVCTFGTATTIDLVETTARSAVFVGGLILPGIDAMHDALTSRTARLPRGVGQVVDFGDRTEDAITSGVMAAQIGAVSRSIRIMEARRASDAAIRAGLCIVGGGAAAGTTASFDELDTPYRVVHHLVLRGLARVAREATPQGERRPIASPT